MPWLRILTEPEMGFYDRESERVAGGLTDNAWPRLVVTGTSHRSLGPGGEAASAPATLDNGDGVLTELLLADPPLGVRAEIGEGDQVLVAGAITAIAGGSEMQITIEGGL